MALQNPTPKSPSSKARRSSRSSRSSNNPPPKPKRTPLDEEDDEDTLDIFDTSLSSLFQIAPIGFSSSSPTKPYTYTPPATPPNPSPSSIQLYLPQPEANIFASLQANNLWLSGVFLADAITTREISLEGLSVAELGAGAGLPAIVAARDGGAKVVVCSDYDAPEVVAAIRRNFEGACPGRGVSSCGPTSDTGTDTGTDTNTDQSSSTPGAEDVPERCPTPATSTWAVVGHSWGTDPTRMLAHAPQGYDVLLLADTIWSSTTHDILLDSVAALLGPKGVVHLAAGLHTGRGPHVRFLDLALARGLVGSSQKEVVWAPGSGWEPHTYEGGSGEERGVVVWYTLHRQ